MASDKGFPSKDREVNRLVEEGHVTSQPVREKQVAKDVISHFAISSVGVDAVEADSSLFLIKATSHLAKVGDVIKFTSGNLLDQEVKVIKTDTNEFELGELLSEAPAIADTFEIFRHTYLQANSGALNVNAIQTPIKFNLDGSEVEVTEDTVTPSNNIPLPVKITSATGDINITAGDLNVQTSHVGASADSMRIGDGTEELSITASGEAETSDASSHTKLDAANVLLTSLDGKDYASQTTLAALLVELQAKADLGETQPVSAASLPLPSGASTEAKQDSAITQLTSIAGEDFATQTTLAALLTELQLKADLLETQPVSAASLPLPSGASTEAKQDAAITQLTSIAGEDFATQTTLAALLVELQLKADLSETQPVSAASLPLPTGAATEAKQDNAITQLTSIAGEDFSTETTLAALSAKITACDTTGKATAAKQDSIITELQSLVSASDQYDVLEFARHDYQATPVTTAAYTQLVASTSADFKELQIFDSSGQTLVLAIGAAASEVDKLYIFPGGQGYMKAKIASGSRISVKAVSADADAGEISINFLG